MICRLYEEVIMTMSADSGKREEKEKREEEDIWRMPMILGIEVIHVHYSHPIPYFIKSKQIEIIEGIEFLVKTSEDFPIRALSPALFVGDFPVMDVNRIGENLYRFFVPAPEIDRLETSAPMSIGWAGLSGGKVTTEYRFQVQREESRQ
jgi:hypothetical protein